MTNSNYLKLFGGASIETPVGPLTGRAVQRHRLALLSLLTVRGGMSRDKLIAWLWPDADTERARHLLSDAIYRINGALGGEAIMSVADEVRLDRQVLPSDIEAFLRAIDGRDTDRAAQLYAGPFLDGFFLPDAREFDQWVEAERARFAGLYARALESLAEAAELARELTGAVQWWRQLANHDPLNARIALRLMAALDAAGDRAAAIRHARVHAALLADDLGAVPDDKVMAYAEQLRHAKPVPPPQVASPAPPPHVASPAPPPPASLANATPEGASVAATADFSGEAATTGAGAVAGATVVPGARQERSRRRRSRGLMALLGTAGLIALWFAAGRDLLPGRGETGAGASIAVLPFVDVSPDGDNEYFSDGMTEELIGMLSRIEGLRVASRTSVFAHKGRDQDVRQIGQQLGVDHVLEGSVRKAGTRLRITANLVNATNGYQLWSDVYERELADIFAVQEEISRAIVSRLRVDLADARLSEPVDPAAYNLYLEGRYHWHRRTRESLHKAVVLFDSAVALAPNYVRAWIGLGDAHAVRGFYDYSPPREAFPAAERAAKAALALDPEHAEAHATLGYVSLYYHWNLTTAEEQFVRATTLDPSYSTGHQWYANLLTAAGRFDEAEREMRLAQEQDPLSLIANAALGWVLYHARDYDRAIAQCRSTLQLNPQFELAHLWMGWAYAELQQYDDAESAVRTALELSDSSALMVASLARVLALRGQRAEAAALLGRIQAPAGYAPSYEIARVFTAMDNADKAFEWLDRAVSERSHSIVFLNVDPQLDALRHDAHFTRLVIRTASSR